MSDRSWRRPIRRRTLALAVLLVCAIVVAVSVRLALTSIGSGLVCHEQIRTSDAILIENFDPDYLLFERAAAIVKAGIADRVLVPGTASADPDVPNQVSLGFVEVMARVARLTHVTFIPVREQEPITFSVAYQVRSFLVEHHIKSVIVLSPGFRSRRSFLVNEAVLRDAGVAVGCVPVFTEAVTPSTWTRTWHGAQVVLEQFAKLQFYRFYVLPFSRHVDPQGQRAAPGHEVWLN